jgi:hypothetical protein
MGDPTAEPGDGSSAPEEIRIARANGYLTAITDVRTLGVRMMMEAVGYLLHPHSNRPVKVPCRNHYCPRTTAASSVWEALEGLGLAEVLSIPEDITKGDITYKVTSAGIEFLRVRKRQIDAERKASNR